LVAMLWVRSYSARDIVIIRVSDYRVYSFQSIKGGLQLSQMTNPPPSFYSTGWQVQAPFGPLAADTYFGFGAIVTNTNIWDSEASASREIGLASINGPSYFFLVIFAIAPAVWLRRSIRTQFRIKHHRCLKCGYDLRTSRNL